MIENLSEFNPNSKKTSFDSIPAKSEVRFYLLGYVSWVLFLFLCTDGLSAAPLIWLHGWFRWDSEWYAKIWLNGYADLRALVFPPGYPFVIGLISELTGSLETAALFVNLFSLFLATVIATEVLSNRLKLSKRRFFIFFLSSPVGFYVFSVYSDAVFLLLFFCALSLAIKPPVLTSRLQKIGAGAILFLMPFLRLAAFPLLIWVFFRRWFALTVLGALACWLFLNFYLSGDPLHFLARQQDFIMPSGSLIDGLRVAVHTALYPSETVGFGSWFYFQFAVLPLAAAVAIAAAALWFFMFGEHLIAVTIVAMALFVHNQAFWRSVLRYDWPLLTFVAAPLLYQQPGEVVRSRYARTWLKLLFWTLVTLGFVIQVLFARRLHEGFWAF